MRSPFSIILLALMLVLGACSKDGEPFGNLAPDTRISLESINLSGDNRLNSTVRLSWYGTDRDGFIKGFELSFDNLTWEFTTTQDTTFLFNIPAGLDTVDIQLFVRAVDNEDLRDPEPATLRIPLKNSPPEVTFDENALPGSSVPLVTTFRWSATDPDGDNTIDQAFIKINEGNWYEIDRNVILFSIVPEDPQGNGAVNARVYYDTEDAPQPQAIDGLVLNDSNRFYIKVTDIAGTESVPDTSPAVFVSSRTADLLVIAGHPSPAAEVYTDILDAVHPEYDRVDYTNVDNLPGFWDPTFRLMIQSYPRLFIHTDESQQNNPVNGQSGLLLDFAAPVLQEYLDEGGKMLITTAFPTDPDLSILAGTFPLDSVSTSVGQAFMQPDSLVVSLVPEYDDLVPSSVIFGLDPMYIATDAEAIYQADLSISGNWSGPNIVAARRRQNGSINQVFFSVELHKLNGNTTALNNLIDQILNNDFN